ncbi:septal ring factor EnvC (AmiA/AmiB activator) [Elusimicrobium simillimum]|uniref:hypothetical protein n=1 Tax=Elusimicrobium simillimum TaxID=3143438 RepID=UPI003C6FB24F
MKKLLNFLLFVLCLSAAVAAQQSEQPPQYKQILTDSDSIISGLKVKMNTLTENSQTLQAQLKATQAELNKSQEKVSQTLTDYNTTITGLENTLKDLEESHGKEVASLKAQIAWTKIRFYLALAGCIALGMVLLKKLLLI